MNNRIKLPGRWQRWVFFGGLWLGLVLLFVPAFLVASRREEGTPPSIVLMLFVFALLLVVMVLLFLRKRLLGALTLNGEAVRLINVGRVGEATTKLSQAIAAVRLNPTYKVLFIYNLQVVRFRQGALEESVSIMEGMIADGWFDVKALVPSYPVAVSTVILGRMLLGDLDAGARWLRIAGERVPEKLRGVLIPGIVVQQLRSGKAEEALETIDGRWSEVELTSSLHGMKVLRILRAFAMQSMELPDHDVEQNLACVRPFGKGEFDHLALAWPELRTFLETHDLLSGGRH